MKRKIILLFLILLLTPILVLAKDTCNDNDIKIKSIILKELNGFSEEIQESSINNNTINLNIKMYDVGDSSTYNITIENTSNEDYYFTKDSMKLENDYLEYSLKNDSETIPANSEKTIELKVSYKNKIPNENYSDTNKLMISLSDKPLENPKTNTNYYILFVILIILIPISIRYHKKGLLILSIFGIVSNVYAVCNVNINVETVVEIDEREAIFLPGSAVNIKMKQLAGDDISSNSYNITNRNIISIMQVYEEPLDENKEEKNIVSISDSPYPIYMWYEDGTIYWWSEDNHPNLNEDASNTLYWMYNLSNISGLKNWDSSNTINLSYFFNFINLNNVEVLSNWNVSKVENMKGIFSGCSQVADFSPISNWRTSNVVDLSSAFQYCSQIKNISYLKNWDVSKVKSMKSLFRSCTSLETLDGINNWNTSKVEDMSFLFDYNLLLKDVSAIKNWDVRRVKSMRQMFSSVVSLEEADLSNWSTDSLENMTNFFGMWNENGQPRYDSQLEKIVLSEKFDTSKVTNMFALFANNTKIEDYSFLRFFDTSNVTDTRQMFQSNNNLTNLEYVKDWDVSKVTSFTGMFQINPFLEDASAINDWNISPTANFNYMFRGSQTHPEFTKVQGTWDVNGTFTPTT